ncbi:Peptidase, M23/M37 family [hydrothermal vent metagenome]|uniref:Peptidase, M23/M37 family n=1 Tax=hydrothermal vent metagenome TaxID=652676 RepID=A0A3B1D4M9_9ZZZZ
MKILILITLFFISNLNLNYAQDLKFYGKLEPGNLIIVKGDLIKRAKLDSLELKIDNDGIFCFGFDLSERGSRILNVKFKDGKVLLKKIQLQPRKFKIQRINNLKKDLVTAPNKLNKRIEKERKIAFAARSPIGKIDTAFYKTGFIRPIKGGRLTSVFGSQRILNGIPKNKHNGLDIAVPRGTPVYAMAAGIVRLAADNFYYPGNYILLDHGQGLNSQYLHLSKKLVKTGDRVKKGEKIGEVGTTGRSTGPHLHWGVQWYLRRVDPAGLLTMGFPDN